MEQQRGSGGNAPSPSNSFFNGTNKDEAFTQTHARMPFWRRLFSSQIFWLSTLITMLLLGLLLGLSIGLTVGKKPESVPSRASPSTYPTPQEVLGPVVDLGYSKYQGDTYPGGISQWLGVRYAQPPVGDLRFAAPLAVQKNSTLQKATKVYSPLPHLGSH